MVKKFKKEIKLKNGQTIPKGTPAEIKMDENNPMIVHLSGAGFDFKSRSANLFNKFSGFVNPYDLDEDMDTCIVPSLRGEDVEPDGYDDEGFPSVFLARGLI